VSSIISFAQWKKEYSPEVEEFMKIVEEKYQTLNSVEDELILSDAELEDAMRKMYFAIAEDPDGYANYIQQHYQKQGEDFEKGIISAAKPTLGTIIGKLQKKIIDKYSDTVVKAVTTPYFLKIKIKDIIQYADKDNKYKMRNIIKGEILEVIKGKSKYKIGDIIEFKYSSPNQCTLQYFINNIYFIPFVYYKDLFPAWYACTGNFLIKDNIVQCPYDVFEIQENLLWENFIEKFKDNLLIFSKE
jgi:hypothetical protein